MTSTSPSVPSTNELECVYTAIRTGYTSHPMTSVPELDQAMDRYARGDDRAFDAVFAELSPRLWRFLRRVCASNHVADDLLQETFLRIHRARGTFQPGGRTLSWAYAICRNCYIDHLRSKPQREAADLDVERIAEPGAGGEAQYLAREVANVVERELASMPLGRREAFVLMRYEGLSVAQTAQVLGISEGAVKVRVHHASQALRQALQEQKGEP